MAVDIPHEAGQQPVSQAGRLTRAARRTVAVFFFLFGGIGFELSHPVSCSTIHSNAARPGKRRAPRG